MEKVYCIFLQIEEGENSTHAIFKLKQGNYLIGSDTNCDIVLKISKEIDYVHAKIIIDDFEDIGIESMSEKGQMYKQKNGHKIIMKKRREYEFSAGKVFYLSEHIKISLLEGSLEEIKDKIKPNEIEYLESYFKTEERPELCNLFYEYEEKKEDSIQDERNSMDDDEIKEERLSLFCDEVISVKTKKSNDKSKSNKSVENKTEEREAHNINQILFTRNTDYNKTFDKALSQSQPSSLISFPKSAPINRQENTSLNLENMKPKSNNETNFNEFPKNEDSLSLQFESVNDQNLLNENFDVEIPTEIKSLSNQIDFQDEENSVRKGKAFNSEESIYSNSIILETDQRLEEVSFAKSKSNISSKKEEPNDKPIDKNIPNEEASSSSPVKKRLNKIFNKKILKTRQNSYKAKEDLPANHTMSFKKSKEDLAETNSLLDKKRHRKENAEVEEEIKKTKKIGISEDSIDETLQPKKKNKDFSDNINLEPILKIAISGGIIIDNKMDKALRSLNYKIVNENDYDFDIMITDKLTHKDIRLLLAINKRIPILSFKWLEDSVKTKEIVPYEKKYYLKDKEGERKYSISISRNNQMEQPAEYCEGYSFYVSDHLSSPSSEEIEELIESAGGLLVDSYAKVRNKKTLILILDKFNDKDMIKNIKSKGVYNIHNADLIVNSVFSQELDLSKVKYKI